MVKILKDLLKKSFCTKQCKKKKKPRKQKKIIITTKSF
jgi:hypothetical protein